MTTASRPMGWDSRDWEIWVRRIQVFFSERGAKLERIMLCKDTEAPLMQVHMKEGSEVVSVDDKATMRVGGVPIMFTTKLPLEKALFLFRHQKEYK